TRDPVEHEVGVEDVADKLTVHTRRLHVGETGCYRIIVSRHQTADAVAATRPCGGVEVQLVAGSIEASDGRDIGTGGVVTVERRRIRKTIAAVTNAPEPCEGIVPIVRDDLASFVLTDTDIAEVYDAIAAG